MIEPTWKPESSKHLEPIRISLVDMAALPSPSTGLAGDTLFQGKVVRATSCAVRKLDKDLWRVGTVLICADEDPILPFYMAQCLFGDDGHSQVGRLVFETLCPQACATTRLDDPGKGDQE